ncbi:Chaperone protein dnaJ 49 [Cardamine amara subsp. amara]|uniref:Chaperone protein dnaJ 49 n=1 Tax=Cardamine amara subsp. amara TaxID=228776 RepID=A0ABD1A0M8_CARAN
MKYDSAMEYYKDEAISAREIAKRKFLANDVAGAKRYAMEAQFLYPELDGIAKMVATFVVLLSAQIIILGGIDYYGILGLNPQADDATVKKRYKELVLMVHPDKNKSPGGAEAFAFLEQARGVLSDKAKRAAYDLKRNVALYEGGGASSSSRTKASGKRAKAKTSKRGRKRASEASAASSTSAHRTSVGGVVTGNKNSVLAAQTGSRKDEVLCIEYNKRRKVTNIASCSAAKTENELQALTIDVPGPYLCDFDKDRSEKSFRDNQIWACYDITEGMPRSYVKIDNVISVDPFEVCISRLTSVTNGELNSTKSLGSKSCGDFKVWKTQICSSTHMFSHNVNLAKGHGDFVIYPRKGDVWALFRNWSPDFDYLTDYEIVEVVEGYTEENGVLVVPLFKVAGFKAVFHHHLDPKETTRFLKDDISRFSHKIPAYVLAHRSWYTQRLHTARPSSNTVTASLGY